MIELYIDYQTLGEARDLAADMGTLKNSFTNGMGNLTGFLGEVLLRERLAGTTEHKNTYDYDLVLPNSKTVDVKSKSTSVTPLDHYECSVSGLNTKQKCDYYAFTRIKKDLTVGWLLGYLPKQEFYDLAKFYPKGSKDPSNRFVNKVDTYSVRIDQLKDITELQEA